MISQASNPVPLRIGLLGASKIAVHALIKPARQRSDLQVMAVAARDQARATDYAAQHNIPVVASDYASLIERDDIDWIYIGVPQSLHAQWTIRALEAGKHVLCEKPFALNSEQAEKMVASAQQNRRFLLEAFHYRFHAVMQRIEAVVRNGTLGKLHRASAVFEASSPNIPGELRWQAELGGGAMMDTGCYTLHALRNVIGREPRVLDAHCQWRNGVDVTTRAQLDFGDNLIATIECSLDTPRQLFSELILEGERGTLSVKGFPLPQLGCEWRLETANTLETVVPQGPSTYEAQLSHVVDVWNGRASPVTGGQDAINTMRVIEAIYRKAAQHNQVAGDNSPG